MSDARVQRRLAAILSADVVGYSKMMGADEAGTLSRLKSLRAEFFHPMVDKFGGRIVKTTGDGTLIEFPSAVDAVQLAAEVQSGLAERNATVPEAERIVLRIGVNVGDIIIDGDDIHGDGVNVAARLEGICGPGDVFVSAAVFDQVAGKIDADFDDLGDQTLKNIARPVRTYRVRLANVGTLEPAHAASSAPLPLPDKPSIAVLPFDSYASDAEQDAFADGMTEDLTTDLSKVAGLFVVARNSAQTFKGQHSNLPQVAQALGVRYLLEGSVRKSGERVRINAQLVDATTGGHLWADRFDGTIHDVFELQDEVGAKVVEALSVTLSQSEKKSLVTVHTDNLEAYELFVRAKATPYPPIPDRIRAAREMFETVIDMAPDFAGGYAGASVMVCFSTFWAHGQLSEGAARGEELARRAIAIDDSFAWSHTGLAMALLLQRKYDEAVAEARETVRLQPNDADGYAYLGLVTAIAGDPDSGADCLREAIRLNPRFFAGPYWNILGFVLGLAGNYRASMEAFETNIRQKGPLGPPAYCWRAAAYAALGDLAKANEVVGELKAAFPQFRLTGWNLMSLLHPEETRKRQSELMKTAGVPE